MELNSSVLIRREEGVWFVGCGGFCTGEGLDRILRDGRKDVEQRGVDLARAFSPPEVMGVHTWGFAPGYGNAGLQPAGVRG